MGMMVSMLGTDTVMKYVTAAYQRYRDRRDIIKANFAAKKGKSTSGASQAKPEDVPMSDDHEDAVEESKTETAEQKRQRFLSKWEKTISEDEQAEEVKQRPLSRAYLSLCPANRASNKQVQDEKTKGQDYLATGQKENFKENHVR